MVQIFHLKIQDEVKAGERLKARALRENRLDDMNDDVIRRRLATYYEETIRTLSFYPKEIVFDVDATLSPLEVLREIVNRLTEVQKDPERHPALGQVGTGRRAVIGVTVVATSPFAAAAWSVNVLASDRDDA